MRNPRAVAMRRDLMIAVWCRQTGEPKAKRNAGDKLGHATDCALCIASHRIASQRTAPHGAYLTPAQPGYSPNRGSDLPWVACARTRSGSGTFYFLEVLAVCGSTNIQIYMNQIIFIRRGQKREGVVTATQDERECYLYYCGHDDDADATLQAVSAPTQLALRRYKRPRTLGSIYHSLTHSLTHYRASEAIMCQGR